MTRSRGACRSARGWRVAARPVRERFAPRWQAALTHRPSAPRGARHRRAPGSRSPVLQRRRRVDHPHPLGELLRARRDAASARSPRARRAAAARVADRRSPPNSSPRRRRARAMTERTPVIRSPWVAAASSARRRASARAARVASRRPGRRVGEAEVRVASSWSAPASATASSSAPSFGDVAHADLQRLRARGSGCAPGGRLRRHALARDRQPHACGCRRRPRRAARRGAQRRRRPRGWRRRGPRPRCGRAREIGHREVRDVGRRGREPDAVGGDERRRVGGRGLRARRAASEQQRATRRPRSERRGRRAGAWPRQYPGLRRAHLDAQQIATLVVDLQRRVLDPEPVVQHVFELHPRAVAVVVDARPARAPTAPGSPT